MLKKSTEEFKASKGGHIPDWIVKKIIHKYYTSKESIKKTFKDTGYRFALMKKNKPIATILISKSINTIFAINSKNLNAKQKDYPNAYPKGYHCAINLVTDIKIRKKGLAKILLKKIYEEYSPLLKGKGIWMRADPPYHDAYVKLGFKHRTKYDVFLPKDVELPKTFSSTKEFNKKYICNCKRNKKQKEFSKTRRYKYSIFTLEFPKR